MKTVTLPVNPQKLTLEEKQEFVASYIRRFGIQIDINDELLPMYYLNYRTAVLLESNLLKTVSAFKGVSDQMETVSGKFEKETLSALKNLNVKQFKFNSPRETFWFGVGSFGVPLLVLIMTVLGCWIYSNWQEEETHKTGIVKAFLQNANVQQQKIHWGWKVHQLKLLPANSIKGAKIGVNYVYDASCQCVIIPLGYEEEE